MQYATKYNKEKKTKDTNRQLRKGKKERPTTIKKKIFLCLHLPNSVKSIPDFGEKETAPNHTFWVVIMVSFFFSMCKEKIIFSAILMTNMDLFI